MSIKNLKISFFIVLFLGAFLPLYNSQAQITVNKAIIHLGPNSKAIQNITVTNSGDQTLFVSIMPEEVLRPGFPDESRRETQEIVFAPKRFSIEAGAQRTVRLVIANAARETEKVYRVKFLPQTDDFSNEKGEVVAPGKTAMVKVLFTVGILVLVDPAAPAPKLEWKREGDEIIFTNSGNVNVLLEDGKNCVVGTETCEDLPAERIYPGNTFKVKAAKDKQTSYRQQIGGQYSSIMIEPSK